MIRMTPKCMKCGRRFPIGNLPNGLPAMLGFQLQDGTTIKLCGYCVCEVGRMSEADKDKFFEELGVKKNES